MRKTRNKPNPGDAVLVKKHPLAIRWFHWINFPVLSIMVWSGLLIFYASRKSGKITVFGHLFPEWLFAPPAPHWVPTWLSSDAGHGKRVFFDLHARLAEGLGW